MYFLCSCLRVPCFRDRRDEVASSMTEYPSAVEAFDSPAMRKRRRPHVDTASSAAEVERNADEVDGRIGGSSNSASEIKN